MTCTRRNHIDCQVMKSDYKKLGHKKPGLWMEDFFVIFFFCRMAWTGGRSQSPKEILHILSSSPPLHFVRVELEHVETAGWEQDGATEMEQGETTGMRRDETIGMGQDETTGMG